MISDQHRDSNQRSLLKSTSTYVIISNHDYLRVFSNRHPFQIFRSMADLLARVKVYASDVIGCRFEKVRNSHRFENLKKDIDLRYTDVCDVEIGHGFKDWRSIRGWASIRVLQIYSKFKVYTKNIIKDIDITKDKL